MLTIRTLHNIKRGSWITFANGIYAILLGIFNIAFFSWILKTNFKAMDVVWQVFEKYNPQITSFLIKLMIIKGFFVIAIGIVIIYLSSYILRRIDKAAWVALFIIGLVFWPSLLTFDVLDKNWYTAAMSFIGWISFLIGMLIPIKYYMSKDYEDY